MAEFGYHPKDNVSRKADLKGKAVDRSSRNQTARLKLKPSKN